MQYLLSENKETGDTSDTFLFSPFISQGWKLLASFIILWKFMQAI